MDEFSYLQFWVGKAEIFYWDTFLGNFKMDVIKW